MYPVSPLKSTVVSVSGGVPVTVVTGPPEFGQINYSYVDITTIGGGLYQIPVSVDIWDVHSNPVADSTNVYFSDRGTAPAYNPDQLYSIKVVDILLTVRSKKRFFRTAKKRVKKALINDSRKIDKTDKFLRDTIVVSAHARNLGFQ